MRHLPKRRPRQAGTSLIEVLVTLVILMVGLLGLTGVMVQSQRAQIESYGRVQALMLMQDMAARISSNRAVADCYAVTTGADGDAPYLGSGSAVAPACALGTAEQSARAVSDLAEWNSLLLGSAELLAGSNVGAVIGARGCVTPVVGSARTYQISVAWQGNDTIGAPPVGVGCAKDLYGDDKQRRAVSVTVRLASLT
jgi:type IV pilus assembly protein PilV